MRVKSLQTALIAISLLISSNLFAKVWVFGDSLSDTGNFQLIGENGRQNFFIPEAYRPNRNGFQRISNGKVAAEYLSAFYGQWELLPSLAGGTNYATFGARIEDPSLLPNCENAIIADLGCQILTFMSQYQGEDIASEQIIISIGGNDVFFALGSATPEADIGNAVANLVAGIETLRAFGVSKILLLNVPDPASTPFLAAQGPAAQAGATLLTDGLNAAIAGYAANVPEVKLVDLNAINKKIAENSDWLGITNTTEACYDVDLFNSFFLDIEPVGNDFTPGDYTDNPAPGYTEGCSAWKAYRYAYWDSVHPTARVHRLSAFGVIKELLLSR